MPYERKIINDPVFGFINIPKGLLYDLVRHPHFATPHPYQTIGIIVRGVSRRTAYPVPALTGGILPYE